MNPIFNRYKNIIHIECVQQLHSQKVCEWNQINLWIIIEYVRIQFSCFVTKSFDFIYFLQSNQVTSVSVYTCKLLRVNVTKHYQLNYGVDFASW